MSNLDISTYPGWNELSPKEQEWARRHAEQLREVLRTPKMQELLREIKHEIDAKVLWDKMGVVLHREDAGARARLVQGDSE